jgi:APA family basic amino acid/polyamine antiporter
VVLGAYLVVHIVKDVTADVTAWYFRSTPLWLLVMALASLIFVREWWKLRRSGVDVEKMFATLPPQ